VSGFLQHLRTQAPKSRLLNAYRRNPPLVRNADIAEDRLRYAKRIDPDQKQLFLERHTEAQGFRKMIGVYSASNS
jgi:hypothetical protein